MKKLLLCIAFTFYLLLPTLQAQGHCSVIMFKEMTVENGKTNVLRTLAGFKSAPYPLTFTTLASFQDYTPDEEHKYQFVITDMKTNEIEKKSDILTFKLGKLPDSHYYTWKWSILFVVAGEYCLTVYVDDIVAQKLYFGVAD